MSSVNESLTSPSLLAQLRCEDRDAAAWEVFVDRYGARIFSWCRSRGLQAADAEDVTQDILVKLAKYLGSFEYDRGLSFRGWLRRVTENAIVDFLREAKSRKQIAGAGSSFDALDGVESQRELSERLAEAYDLELFDLAKERVRRRVEQRRWEAWELLAVKQWTGQNVATKLSMKLPSVYSSRFQIQSMIADEVAELEARESEMLQTQS